MVGLRILLEAQNNIDKGPVINKVNMIKTSSATTNSSSVASTPTSLYSPSSLPAITFLDSCFLCKQKLLPGQDIYMYKGDRAFCSVECRCRHIFIDEESVRRKKCSPAAMNVKVKPTSLTSPSPSPSSSSSSSSSSSRHSHRREIRNRAGGFV
ncbi:FCS-Like Zinc finger 15 [Macadamia integrifolia]|uniref:FCS-Like Zinc finger 15 n=1 Tax=Macadamia integrifolia TaxID=60698 RepID=UPI001C4F073F|nr:FCS-Like Zinc finger 15 [Macadamia integrifolia]